ncbi:hypothetical protein K439DRAFT_1024582 [Ramaria rubella]|nr:hypothetical protein K439DRAFT_1024582 [Ramaria rubella]
MVIIDLPDEILDKCLQELSKTFGLMKGSIDEVKGVASRDILNVRLVSRLFDRLAIPWAWRKIDISLENDYHTGAAYTPFHPNRLLGKWADINDYSRLIKHARIFFMDCDGIEGHALSFLTTFVPALHMMENLQVVRLSGCSGGEAVAETSSIRGAFLKEILEKPRLHTFVEPITAGEPGVIHGFIVPPFLMRYSVEEHHPSSSVCFFRTCTISLYDFFLGVFVTLD